MEEDEDRVAHFLQGHSDFKQISAADAVAASDLLTEQGIETVRAGEGPEGGVRLTPRRAGTDGFFFAVMTRTADEKLD